MFDIVVVFMENKAGKLAKITKVLADNNINLFLSDIEDTGQFGIFKFLTNEPGRAKDVLYNNNFTVALEKTVIVELEDKAGGLAGVAEIMDRGGINVTDALGCILETGKKAVLTIRSDNPEKLEALLKQSGVKVLDTI